MLFLCHKETGNVGLFLIQFPAGRIYIFCTYCHFDLIGLLSLYSKHTVVLNGHISISFDCNNSDQ